MFQLMNLKIKITLETKRLLMLRKSIKTKTWCAECNAETDFVNKGEINDILEKLDRKIETDKLHKMLAADGTILICLESLLKNQS